jgi:hypothetical protein
LNMISLKSEINICIFSLGETYLSINNFRLRRALCQIRISAHELKIERDRYNKPYVERSQN